MCIGQDSISKQYEELKAQSSKLKVKGSKLKSAVAAEAKPGQGSILDYRLLGRAIKKRAEIRSQRSVGFIFYSTPNASKSAISFFLPTDFLFSMN
jgi:hypothetical protein